MNDIFALPSGRLAEASLALVQSTESPSIADHSIRTFLFARLIAEREGCVADAAYDENLLFAATVMHDLGLGDQADGKAPFEVEGADLAASVLKEHGVPQGDIDRVWEAIALHSSIGVAHRLGLLTYLTYKGVFVDAGRIADAIAAPLQEEVLAAYPKGTDENFIFDAIMAHGLRSEDAAPPGSLSAFLLLARQIDPGSMVG